MGQSRTVAFVLLLALCGRPAPAQQTDGPPEWKAFRATYPYHTQSIAVGDPGADGSRLMVISEPPPAFALNDIVSIDSSVLRDARVYRHRIGWDGWVRDVVVRLPRMQREALNELLAQTHLVLFGTTYGARVINLEALPKIETKVLGSDIAVRYNELRQWLMGPRALRFGRGAQASTIPRLLALGEQGIRWSTDSSLVTWLLPREGLPDNAEATIRRFAIDTDLLVAAVAESTTMAIIGRARRVPAQALPPLRTETIALLASVQGDELAQSYERNTMFAGRGYNEKDWAPIYLSRVLQHTEYGSLLNITDQLLKGWSQAGTVGYVNFDYPRPAMFPFPVPLDEHLRSPTVTFNWNTKGVGYVVREGKLTIYGVQRTGALPVSYFAGEDEQNAKTIAAERVGYEYFASLRDPNLVRVVQYAFLYQAFRSLRSGRAIADPDADTSDAQVLAPMLHSVVRDIRRDDPSRYRLPFGSAVLRAQRSLDSLERRSGIPGIDALVSRLLVLRVPEPPSIRSRELDAAYSSVRNVAWIYIDTTLTERARGTYELAARSKERGWITTPTVVESFSTGGDAIGGHNLSARVSRFRSSSGVPRGRPTVVVENNQLVIVAHPGDIPRLTGRLRAISTAQTPEAFERAISAGGGAPPPPRTTRLALGDFPEPSPRGPVAAEADKGFAVGFLPVRRATRASSPGPTRENYSTLRKLEDGSYEYTDTQSGDVLRAYSATAASELMATRASALRPPPGPRVELFGFGKADAQVFAGNVERTVRQRSIANRRRAAAGESRASEEAPLELLRNDVPSLAQRQELVQQLDWSQTKVSSFRQLADPRLPDRVGYEFELSTPLAATGARGAVVRITAWARGIVAELRSILDQKLPGVLRSALSSEDPAVYLRTVLREAHAGIEDVQFEIYDMQVVVRPELTHGPHRVHAAN